MGDSSHIQVRHLQEFANWLHTIFKHEHGFSCDVTKTPSEYSIILRQVTFKLISKLEALVEFDFGLHLGSDRLLRQDIGEVICNLVRIDLLDLTSREFDKALKAFDVGFASSNGN